MLKDVSIFWAAANELWNVVFNSNANRKLIFRRKSDAQVAHDLYMLTWILPNYIQKSLNWVAGKKKKRDGN